jgi:hypothetical protein
MRDAMSGEFSELLEAKKDAGMLNLPGRGGVKPGMTGRGEACRYI